MIMRHRPPRALRKILAANAEIGVSLEKTEALVLRGVDFSESSRIVTFLTPGRGRLVCIVKGARRKNSPFTGVLETFNRVELVYYWKEGRQTQILGEAALLDEFAGLKRDLERVSYAGWPLEVAARVAHENEPSEELFAALAEGLASLCAWPGSARLHACWQVLGLLNAAGFAPSLEACVRCGSLQIPDAPGFALDGGVVCAGCAGNRRLSADAYRLARMLEMGGCPAEVASLAHAELFDVLAAYVAHQTEMEFRSVRVLKQMFG